MAQPVTADYVRYGLTHSDQWLMMGLVRIFEYQTAHEQNIRHTVVANGVGFNSPDSRLLTTCAKYLLRMTDEPHLMANKHAHLEDFFNSQYHINEVRKRMPKYAGQLARIANHTINPELTGLH